MLGKVMDPCLFALGQNGEPCFGDPRPHILNSSGRLCRDRLWQLFLLSCLAIQQGSLGWQGCLCYPADGCSVRLCAPADAGSQTLHMGRACAPLGRLWSIIDCNCTPRVPLMLRRLECIGASWQVLDRNLTCLHARLAKRSHRMSHPLQQLHCLQKSCMQYAQATITPSPVPELHCMAVVTASAD
jgi:hypothetical protein